MRRVYHFNYADESARLLGRRHDIFDDHNPIHLFTREAIRAKTIKKASGGYKELPDLFKEVRILERHRIIFIVVYAYYSEGAIDDWRLIHGKIGLKYPCICPGNRNQLSHKLGTGAVFESNCQHCDRK